MNAEPIPHDLPRTDAEPAAPRGGLAALAARVAAETQTLWTLDRGWPDETLKGRAYRRRRFRIRFLRHAVQGLFLALVLWIGFDFVRWVRGLEVGRIVGERPPGVDGFLPISGLMSLRHLFHTGEISPVHPAAPVILLLVIGMSLVVKKAFCSWACPVGAISEALDALSRRLFRRRISLPRWLDLPLRSLKYLLLGFFAWAIFFQMTPALIAEFLASPYNRVADIKMLYFFEHLSPFAAKVLVGLAVLSFVVPYAWCRYLCPYGALLGITSLLAPFKIVRHAPSCIDCGLCAKACPARLPVDRLQRVRSDECFGCLSCTADCPVPRALRLEAPSLLRRPLRPAFAALALVALFGAGVLAARLTGNWQTSVPDAEYLHRIHELDGPQYDHLR